VILRHPEEYWQTVCELEPSDTLKVEKSDPEAKEPAGMPAVQKPEAAKPASVGEGSATRLTAQQFAPFRRAS